MPTRRSIAAVGDVCSHSCWSGIPFHFFEAASRAGFATDPLRIDLGELVWSRRGWNLKQLLRGRGHGGFQYSTRFLDLVEAQIPPGLWEADVISFNQHFPRAATVRQRGGSLHHYIDAPFAALATGRGLPQELPAAMVEEAMALERSNYAASARVITMARWAAKVAVEECDVSPAKVHVILPGANLDLPEGWEFPVRKERAGVERDFTLGFVGKDWKRKGLPLLVSVRDELERRGWKCRVLVIGDAPSELRNTRGVGYAGYVDKDKESRRFLELLSSCDLGCLFSEREALGISTLEFLRAGVPVAGFDHEGMADTIPPDAGFRFAAGSSAESIADRLEEYLQNEAEQANYGARAREWSGWVTWERCVREFQELWETGRVAAPVQPWKGLIDR
jgi:glycosyltransferase involved in cell wall biosynthesis